MDWMRQEQDRGITITSAVTTCYWRDHHINIIDTPGHVDFTAEVERALRVLDGSITIFDVVAGVEPQSEMVWKQSNKYGVARIAYINKMDRVGADWQQTIKDIRSKLSTEPLPLMMPVGLGTSFDGIIDLLSMKMLKWDEDTFGLNFISSDIPASLAEEAQYARTELVETLANINSDIEKAYLEDKVITVDELKLAIRMATISATITPVYCGASLRNIGVQPLLDAVVDFFPAPDELPPINAYNVHNGKKMVVARVRDASLSALIFKIAHDPNKGELCFVRVYSGELKSGSNIYNVNKNAHERVLRLLRMHADRSERIDKLIAGDIGAIIGFKRAQTGDSIGVNKSSALLERISFPEPVISKTIEPRAFSERGKLKHILAIMNKEDPTLHWRDDEETAEIIISGMGELHLDVIVTRLINDYNMDVRVGQPRVSYRESIVSTATHYEVLERIIAGKNIRASVTMTVAPNKDGNSTAIQLNNDLSEDIIAACRRGIETALSSGVLQGYAMVNIAATVTAIEFDSVSDNLLLLEAAATQCFELASKQASPILMEPLMRVIINVPPEFIGEIIASITKRNGQIDSVESHTGYDQINALVPLRHLFGYTTVVRSATQGRAHFTTSFALFVPYGGNK